MGDPTNALFTGLGIVMVIFTVMALEHRFGWELDFGPLNFSLVMGAFAVNLPFGSATQILLGLLSAVGLALLPFASRRKTQKKRRTCNPET